MVACSPVSAKPIEKPPDAAMTALFWPALSGLPPTVGWLKPVTTATRRPATVSSMS